MPRGDHARGVVVQKPNGDAAALEDPLQIGQGELLKIVVPQRTRSNRPAEISRRSNRTHRPASRSNRTRKSVMTASSRWISSGLVFKPDEEFGVAQQIGGDVQRSAGDGKADAMAGRFDFRPAALAAGGSRTAAGRRCGSSASCRRPISRVVVQRLFGGWESVLVPNALRPEGRGLGTHAVFGPKTGQQQDRSNRRTAWRFASKPDAVVGEVVEHRRRPPSRAAKDYRQSAPPAADRAVRRR